MLHLLSTVRAVCLGALLAPAAAQTDALVLELAQDMPPLRVEARWSGFESSTFRLYENDDYSELASLAPSEQYTTHAAADFRPLLPETEVGVGETWTLPADAVARLARQLHPGATGEMHHLGPIGMPGAAGVLRAVSPTHAEVLVRAHCDFAIPMADGGTIWFTPAQLAGRLVIDRSTGALEAFQLALPARDPNVDVNVWAASARTVPSPHGPLTIGGKIDIGFVPEMGLYAGALDARHEWTAAVEPRDALRSLAEELYAFARIPWLPLDEAVLESRRSGRPLHVLTMFGALDDESC